MCKYKGCPMDAEGVEYCILHNKDYLKDDNYDKNKEEVASKFRIELERAASSSFPQKPMNFSGYHLPDVSFESYTFSRQLIFSEATFHGTADFSKATFSNEANFINAEFKNGVKFNEATFEGKAKFNWATLTETGYFDQTTFMDKADFSFATFEKTADFSFATFMERADFTAVGFTKEANFLNAKFLKEVLFSGQVFEDQAVFNYTIFEQPYKALFDVDDLSKVSFARTDISKVTFTDKVKWDGKDHLKIFEEEWMETGGGYTSLGLTLYVYRRLRENYEFNLKFDEAGKFFIKEMELNAKLHPRMDKIILSKKTVG